jgi:hypothetical protein
MSLKKPMGFLREKKEGLQREARLAREEGVMGEKEDGEKEREEGVEGVEGNERGGEVAYGRSEEREEGEAGDGEDGCEKELGEAGKEVAIGVGVEEDDREEIRWRKKEEVGGEPEENEKRESPS